jgi:hypothetical protein
MSFAESFSAAIGKGEFSPRVTFWPSEKGQFAKSDRWQRHISPSVFCCQTKIYFATKNVFIFFHATLDEQKHLHDQNCISQKDL